MTHEITPPNAIHPPPGDSNNNQTNSNNNQTNSNNNQTNSNNNQTNSNNNQTNSNNNQTNSNNNQTNSNNNQTNSNNNQTNSNNNQTNSNDATATSPSLHPKPIYNKDQLVARRSRPHKALHIYDNPHWSEEWQQWIYHYDYGLGLTSEGSALEGELILAPEGSVL